MEEPEKTEYKYDKATWGKTFDLKKEKPDTGQVNGFLLYMMEFYKRKECTDDLLWEYFQDDFKGWTKEILSLGEKKLVREFRDFLRAHGVFIVKGGQSIAEELARTITEDEYHE